MNVDLITSKSCCSNKSNFILKFSTTIDDKFISFIEGKGFVKSASYLKYGVLQVENKDIILSGSIGSNILKVKQKNNNVYIVNEMVEILKAYNP